MSIAYWIIYYSSLFGMSPALVGAIVEHESRCNAQAIGNIGEVGLMQIRPEYTPVSRHMLLDPKVNIIIGINKLLEAKKYCRHKKDNTFVVCFNAGIVGGNKIKNPYRTKYYKDINRLYKLKRIHCVKNSTLQTRK